MAKVLPPSGDYGADLVLDNKKGRTVVQAKRYSKPVGVKAVQEVGVTIEFGNYSTLRNYLS